MERDLRKNITLSFLKQVLELVSTLILRLMPLLVKSTANLCLRPNCSQTANQSLSICRTTLLAKVEKLRVVSTLDFQCSNTMHVVQKVAVPAFYCILDCDDISVQFSSSSKMLYVTVGHDILFLIIS